MTAPPPQQRSPLVAKELRVPFLLLLLCFAAWGTSANLTDVLVGVFRSIFTMTNLESSLVQFAYYGAYFLLAIPAAMINQRFGFKAGLLTGLGLAAAGGFLFIPAAKTLAYGLFLLALFTLASGLSILETSANPLVIAMGDEATSTRRLNLAQAFNPIGANLGVLMGAVLILPHLTPETAKSIMTEQDALAAQEADLNLVLGPYLGIATALVIIWLLIAFRKLPLPPQEAAPEGGSGRFGRLWGNKLYRYGVAAQFFNVAAQVCCWTYIIQYTQQAIDGSLQLGSQMLQISLIVFLIARFVMTAVIARIRATKVMAALGALAVALCIYAALRPDITGVIAVIAISLCLSLMFPTIYGVALAGLGEATKFGAAGLVMAIVGGAIMPMVQGKVMDATSAATSFIVPALCFAMVTLYAIYDLRTPTPRVIATTSDKRKAQ